ncbi:hydrolase [Anaerocolumna cellulosilytica]|uniref:Hydrolase n=1 Tax=Anaerocolumna cellulosilytica TaxID=433286 RepID=A0A6S6R1S7_9FIRM|nr:UxaA family hydrolase [Anaerocolumna cellulosilytica]MBB5194327.1 altronate hydrolase [Anaerocolumna cellulosilytica]BCJ93270.1 hydrolase [Anaerocolumna cellulosilytica]
MDLNNKTWKAYLRKNGTKGIRNKLLVIYTVECASFVAKEIASKIGNNDTEVIGFSGCTDNAYAIRLLIALIRHPNVGGVLAVGLGCEYVQPEWLAEIAEKEGKASAWFFIQEAGGTRKGIEKGLALAADIIKELQKVPLAPMDYSELVIGAECGGSDYTSGLAGNVVVGHFYDWLTDTGGTAVFEEIVEAVGLKEFLCGRAAHAKARKELSYTYDKALAYCKSVNQYSVSPGNFAGGLSTIEEKSMGALIKSGTKPIQGVLKVGEVPVKPGLWLLDSTPDPYWMSFGITNPNDNEGLMDLISCGCHITFLVTGRGNVVGSAVAPVLKITGNSETYRHLVEDMDFDAGRVLEGECTQQELTYELAELTALIAGGQLTKGESLGHKEYFIPYKYQEKKVSYAEPVWSCCK